MEPGAEHGEHLVGIGVYAEMTARIKARPDSEQYSAEYHYPGAPSARINQTNKYALQKRCA